MTTSTAIRRQAGVAQGITLLLPSGLSIMAIVVLVPILPLLFEHFRALPGAEYRVPMLLTVPAACLIFASPAAGWVSDRVGRRPLLIWAMAAYTAVGCLPLVIDSYWGIFASRIALGLVEAVVLTVSTALIGDFFKGPERERWLGYQIGVASIFATTLIWAGGALSAFGWRGPFVIYASALLMLAAVIRFTWEPDEAAMAAIPGSAENSDAAFPWARMAGLCGLTLFASILFYFVLIQLPIMLAMRGMPPSATSGFWLAIVSLGVTAGTLVFGQIARLGSPRLLLIAFIILGSSFWVMSGARSTAVLLAASTINQFGAGILMPTLLTWATRGLPFHFRGRGTGLWQGTFSLGQFMMPILVTYLSGALGGLSQATLTFAWLAGAAAAILAIWLTLPSSRIG